MRCLPFLRLVLLVLTAAMPLAAQKPLTEKEVDARIAAHAADFDYLLGDWEFTSVSKEWGPGQGKWSAVRLESGAIFDEYRILGDSGQTWYVTHTLRSYDAVANRWDLVGIDRGTGLRSIGHGTRSGNEFHIEQTFTSASRPSRMTRIHYYDIARDSFRWELAQSTDGGKSWTARHQTIEARRIGPPRPVEQMTRN